jgi:hypothetical protein
MARLIDDLRTTDRFECPTLVAPQYEKLWAIHTQRVRELLMARDLPVLRIDNVAEYHAHSAQEHWSVDKDFPNLAPPWPVFWVEHKIPTRLYSDECGTTDMSCYVRDGRIGVLVTAVPREDAKGEGIPENAKWILWLELVIDYGKIVGGFPQYSHGPVFVAVDAEGRAIGFPWGQSFCRPSDAAIAKSMMTWFHPTFLAISFLHCKNVKIVDDPPPEKLAKLFRKKHQGIQMAQPKVLIIEPLKQILKTEGRSGEVGLAKAMHICRGHFRDYREGRGLFGKYKQLVWTPMTVRGTKGKEAPPREVEVRI